MRPIVLVFCLVLFPHTAVAQAPSSIDSESIDKTLLEFIRMRSLPPKDTQNIQRWRKATEAAESSRVGRGQPFPHKRAQQTYIEELKVRVAMAVAGFNAEPRKIEPEWTHLTSELTPGNVYRVFQPQVDQVFDDNTIHAYVRMRVSPPQIEETRVAILVDNASDFANRKTLWTEDRVCLCVGTDSYKTVSGGSKTIPVLMDVSERWAELLKRQAKPESQQNAVFEISRTWESSDGRFSTKADLIGLTPPTIKLRKTDGKEIELKISQLSLGDRIFLDGYQAAQLPEKPPVDQDEFSY